MYIEVDVWLNTHVIFFTISLYSYKPVIVTCSLPDERYPTHVSIVDLNQAELPPLDYVPISDNIPLKDRKRNFTMCLSPLHGNPSSALNLIQYFELNRILGADYFIVYNHSQYDRKNNELLNYYQQLGFVEIVQWKLPALVEQEDAVWYKAQLLMLQDCVYRNKGISKYVATTDLDEFIIPLNSQNWTELLSKQPDACEYQFRSVVLRRSDEQKRDQDVFKEHTISTLLNMERATHIFPVNVRSKYIIQPNCVVVSGVHFMVSIQAQEEVIPTYMVPINEGLTYHYTEGGRFFATLGLCFHDTTLDRYAATLMQITNLVFNSFNSTSKHS